MAARVSVLLPTYNERDNLPLVVWLLERTLSDRYRAQPQSRGVAGARSGMKNILLPFPRDLRRDWGSRLFIGKSFSFQWDRF